VIDGRGWGSRLLRIYLPVVGFLVVMLFPFYWMLIASF
jgi:ABC-type glycerol-3-phosphate transport system permease component